MTACVISGTGLFTPDQSISNAELVESFNSFVDNYNAENAVSPSGRTRSLQSSARSA